MKQDQAFKKPEQPMDPSLLTTIPSVLQFWLGKGGFSGTSKILLSDTHHKKLILLLEQEGFKEVRSSGQEKDGIKPFAIFRKAQLDSVSKSPQSLVSRAAFM